MNKKPSLKPAVTTTTEASASTAAVTDPVAVLRASPSLRVDELPSPPESVAPVAVSVSVRRRQLALVAESDIPALILALAWMCDDPEQLMADLGDMGVDFSAAEPLHGRITGLRATLSRLGVLTALCEQQLDVALSDAHSVVDLVAGEIEHRAQRNPVLASRHAAVVAYRALRGQAVADGMARARRAKEKKPAAPAAATADKPADKG